MPATVLVSGASGFIAQHIVRLLISKGYNVIGTVRSAQKGDRLKSNLSSKQFTYEIVPDISSPNALDAVVQNHPEATIFLHTASPFHYKASDIEKELLLPAVNGTINALSAIKKHGPQIKSVVVTSSYVAMWNYAKFYDPTHTDTETSWNPISWAEGKVDSEQGYYASKTFAEKEAWDFYKREKPAFDLNFVNPVLVFGPQAFDSEVSPELNASSEIINRLLKLGPEAEIPDFSSVFVDVRDVAKAHIAAFEKGLSGERLLLYSSKFTNQDIIDIVNDNFRELRNRLSVGNPGSGSSAISKICTIDDSRTRQILGSERIGLKSSVIDTVRQILENTKQL
ncbi:hypothetical protein OXX79_000216 [Metschnikowia pulcherrima]